MPFYIGIDPGASGAIVALDEHGEVLGCVPCRNTEHDLRFFLLEIPGEVQAAAIEKVSAMPKQGVSSTFKFGQSYGFLRGLLVAHGIPFEAVTPAKWQGDLGCRSGGDKNVTKAAAQRRWPGIKWTHATADAALIAEWARLHGMGARR